MAAAVPNTDITAMLGSLMEIISKYEDKDPDNMPNEGDYLLAMNTLKALNDRKGNFSAVQRQVVVQIRERVRRLPNLLELTQRHAHWMTKKLMDYVSCDICGTLIANEYALNRHKKRQNCKEMRARVEFFGDKFRLRCERWNNKGFVIDFPFFVALCGILDDARPKILILPNAREYTWPQNMIPRRILPVHFWESIWSATAQSVNEKFAFRYDPNMFCHIIRRDGPSGTSTMFRHSIVSQAEKIYVQRAEEQYRSATSVLSRPTTLQQYITSHRRVENWRLHFIDKQPLIQMSIAPNKRPRFRCVPQIMNYVAGADPLTDYAAELANFSTIVPAGDLPPLMPQSPSPPVADGVAVVVQNEDDGSDDSEVSINV